MSISAIAAAAMLLLGSGADRPDEEPAVRLTNTNPEYPASCRPENDQVLKRERVVVAYGVNKDGLPENVRVRESSNECFNEVAVATVRSWRFKPRKYKRRKVAQEDMETNFLFVFDGETVSEDFDARPIVRLPPKFPDHCQRRAKKRETILLEFDVTKEGKTENIRVLDSTNTCFEGASISSVRKWKYHPAYVDGVAVDRPNVQTSIFFILASGSPEPSEIIRSGVRRELNKARKIIRKEGDLIEAEKILEELEEKYGASFTSAETSAFYHTRGILRISQKDYTRALDDLRIASRNNYYGQNRESIETLIAQLDAFLAAQDTSNGSQADQPPEQEWLIEN